MSEITPSGPEQLAQDAFDALQSQGREDILRRWRDMAAVHTKSAREADDADKKKYFVNMATPYDEAADHLDKLIRRAKNVRRV